MAAIPDPLSGELSPETSALYQELVSRRGRIDGMYRFLLNHPDLLQRISDLGTYFRFQSTVLPSRVKEFAILVTARELRAGYEWVKHVPLALEAGLKQETIEQLRHGSSPSLGQEFMDVRGCMPPSLGAGIHPIRSAKATGRGLHHPGRHRVGRPSWILSNDRRGDCLFRRASSRWRG